MFTAVAVLTLLGVVLGLLLGYADRIFAVDENPLVKEVEAMLPGTHCGQCGFPGCSGAAQAMVDGEASVTCCPPGGRSLAAALAEKLGVTADLSGMATEPMLARIDESLCTGCCRCYRVCPTDAIMGANKQIHVVFADACTGCNKCAEACPEDCISMQPEQETLDNWQWPKPAAA